MTRQMFTTTNRLRLEVGKRPDTGPRNMLANGAGNLGTWGWVTPIAQTELMSTNATPYELWDNTGGLYFSTAGGYSPAPAVVIYLQSEKVPVKPGEFAKGSLALSAAPQSGESHGIRIVFYDGAGTEIGSTAETAIPNTAVLGNRFTTPTGTAPAGTTHAALRIHSYGTLTQGRSVRFNSADLVVGSVSAEVTAYAYTPPYTFTQILSPSYEIEVDRGGLTLGTLTARIADVALDPANNNLIRPGNPVRLLAQDPNGTPTWFPIFTGEVDNGTVRYDYTRKRASQRADITLVATDAAKRAANLLQPDGVAGIADLRYVLEGCGIPWNINGATNQPAGTPAVVSRNDKASVLDQVGILRDSELGHAWVSRFGVLTAYGTPPATLQATLSDADYNADLVIDYDTRRIINTVIIKALSINPADGTTVETVYGPYTDDASIAVWGSKSQEFTMQGQSAATYAARAAAILAANAQPSINVQSLTIPVTTDAHFSRTVGSRRVLLDLYDRVRVTNVPAALDKTLRVATIKHRITPEKWLMDIGFAATGGVAMPAPAPPLPSGTSATFPDTPWFPLPFGAGGWSNYSAGFAPAEYRRYGGMVQLRGLIKSGGVSAVIATLPAGFRIATAPQLWACCSDSGTTRIDTEGSGVLRWQTGATGFVSLSGIEYPAEQ